VTLSDNSGEVYGTGGQDDLAKRRSRGCGFRALAYAGVWLGIVGNLDDMASFKPAKLNAITSGLRPGRPGDAMVGEHIQTSNDTPLQCYRALTLETGF